MTNTKQFIAAFDGPWHVAETKVSVDGERTYVVAACTGKQIGGAWGPHTYRFPHDPKRICKNCQKLLKNRSQS